MGPYGWRGEHKTLDEHVTTTIANLAGKGLPDAELASLLTFVRALPKRSAAGACLLTEAESARGKGLFASAECSNCHTATGSDRALHDVGTGGAFMTPTLASVGTRNGLMHDHRYQSLDDLLARSTIMGRGASLSPDERHALVRWLETL